MGTRILVTAGIATAALALATACGAKPSTNGGAVSEGTGGQPANNGQPAAENEAPKPPTWGQRYTWKDGLAIEVAAPVACEPGEYAIPEDAERAVKFSVTLINDTKDAVDVGVFVLGGDVQFDGKPAEMIIDIDGPCDSTGDSGTVLPGKTFTYEQSYAVGANPGEMQLTFQAELTGDRAVYVGQA